MGDLLSLVLTLRPLEQPESSAPLHIWWGRAAHSLLLDVARQYNPGLSDALHEPPSAADASQAASSNAIRPFSVSTLVGRFSHVALDPHSLYSLRFTTLNSELASILLQAASGGPLAPGARVELDYRPFQIESAIRASPSTSTEAASIPPGAQPALADWAGQTTYQELSASLLLSKEPAPRRVTLYFASPTTFKSGGLHMPVPLPELVFGSLLERWNAFASLAFPPEGRRYASECLAIGRYQLSSRMVTLKSGGQRVGAVGEVTYTSVNYDRYWMSLVGVLAAFALYSGVGASTSMGLGQCREISEGRKYL